MPGRLLLDTNAAIGLLQGDAQLFETLSTASEVFIASVVLGELYYGASKSSRADKNMVAVDRLASSTPVLVSDVGTAREYGRIKAALRARGRPIPENDVWIAALALQHSLVLLTRDSHFDEVQHLRVERW